MRKIGILALALTTALTVAACAKNNNSTAASETSAATGEATTGAGEASAAPMQGAAAGAGNAAGAKVYQTNCSSCHQADGKGVPESFPPLAGNSVVNGDAKTVIHIVKYGLNGKIEVAGHAYNGIMPPWGSQLSNADIAAAVTYVRSSWGNSASAVSESDVGAVTK